MRSVSQCQLSALEHVRRRAEAARAVARGTIAALLERSGIESDALIRTVFERADVTLNFHPDRPLCDGRTVVEKLLAEGRYQSQFVTGISSGSRTAFAGGDRDVWERTLFGGAYHGRDGGRDGVRIVVPMDVDRADERPKYGGLNVMGHADGACPRFGSCYFKLRPHMIARCTFTWGDSHQGPEHVGTSDAFEPVLAALLECVATTGDALGAPGFDVPSFANFVTRADQPVRRGPLDPAEGSVGRALDAYIEAQVHSDIDLARDVAALVIDPAFGGTPTGDHVRAMCAKHEISLQLHPGFVLAPTDVSPNFRGPRMVPLAARLDERFARVRGELDAVVIGEAAQSLHREPAAWRDWGTADETLQHLKQLWHVLVRYGRARNPRLCGV